MLNCIAVDDEKLVLDLLVDNIRRFRSCISSDAVKMRWKPLKHYKMKRWT
jgi:hypothetical protein